VAVQVAGVVLQKTEQAVLVVLGLLVREIQAV
jgi:hypothetical protein